MTSVLIVGATGLVGKCALEQALADQRISRVVALTRRPIARQAKLENVVVDFDALPLDAAWWSVDGVISALGTTRAAAGSRQAYRTIDFDYPLSVARLAREHGATRLSMVSSLGANPRSLFSYTRTKGELENEMAKLGFRSLTIVRPSVLDGHRDKERADERTARAAVKILAPLLPRQWRLSPANAIAKLLIDSAVHAPAGVHVRDNRDMFPATHG